MSNEGPRAKYTSVSSVRIADLPAAAAALGSAASAVASTAINAASVAPEQDLMGCLKAKFLTDLRKPFTADNINFTNLKQVLPDYPFFKDLERDPVHAIECEELKKAVAIRVLKEIYQKKCTGIDLEDLKLFLTDDYTSKQISKSKLVEIAHTDTNKQLLQNRATNNRNFKTNYREIIVKGKNYVLVNYTKDTNGNLQSELGKGGFGRARTAWLMGSENRIFEKQVAVKKLKVQDAEDLCTNYLEYCAQKGLAGDYVVAPYAFVARKGGDFKQKPVLIFQEKGVGLDSEIVRLGRLSDDQEFQEVILFFQDAAKALQHCHNQGIAHGDFKWENMLRVGNSLKLIDFGMCSQIPSRPNSLRGTYQMPELIKDEKGTLTSDRVDLKKVDVWTFGVLMCKALDSKLGGIVRGRSLSDFVQMREELNNIACTHCLDTTYNALFTLAMNCLSIDPNKRPTMQDVLAKLGNIQLIEKVLKGAGIQELKEKLEGDDDQLKKSLISVLKLSPFEDVFWEYERYTNIPYIPAGNKKIAIQCILAIINSDCLISDKKHLLDKAIQSRCFENVDLQAKQKEQLINFCVDQNYYSPLSKIYGEDLEYKLINLCLGKNDFSKQKKETLIRFCLGEEYTSNLNETFQQDLTSEELETELISLCLGENDLDTLQKIFRKNLNNKLKKYLVDDIKYLNGQGRDDSEIRDDPNIPSKIVNNFVCIKELIEKKIKQLPLELEDEHKAFLNEMFEEYSVGNHIKVAECNQLSDFFGLGFSLPPNRAVPRTKGKTPWLWSLFCCGARPRDVSVVLKNEVPPSTRKVPPKYLPVQYL